MSDNQIVKHMIDFIEEKERELQASKMGTDTQAKNGIIRSIISELERELKNENNES